MANRFRLGAIKFTQNFDVYSKSSLLMPNSEIYDLRNIPANSSLLPDDDSRLDDVYHFYAFLQYLNNDAISPKSFFIGLPYISFRTYSYPAYLLFRVIDFINFFLDSTSPGLLQNVLYFRNHASVSYTQQPLT